MTYSIPALIAYNLSELRRHMLAQGCTEKDWLDGLFAASKIDLAQRDPENLDPFGAQNHEAP